MTTTEIKALWRTLPLGKENDLLAMDVQIERRPEAWEAVARFLQEADLDALPLGRNEIGAGAYANVSEYETKTANLFELHRQYIDVQILASGREWVYVADKQNASEPQGSFDEAGDYILYADATDVRRVVVSRESIQLFFPSDAHKPCMAVDGKPASVRKICVKVPYFNE